MDLLKNINNQLFEIANELRQLNISLHSLGNPKYNRPEYLTLVEITEQYPVSRETLIRLKDADILKVSRLTARGKYLVERKHFEEVIKSNAI